MKNDTFAQLYAINHPEQIFSPGLVLFRDLLEQNLETMISIAGDASLLRPHCKTHKMPAVIKLELALGITKHKAATIAEAEMLAEAGVRDIALAYNIVGPNLGRMVAFRQRFPHVDISVTADDLLALQQLSDAMTAVGETIGVCLDINPGRDRTGVGLDAAAEELYAKIAQLSGTTPAGLHIYDGHLHQADFDERLAAVTAFWQEVLTFRDRLTRRNLPVPRLICGGTPTFPAYATLSDPTLELSPGTCVFHDAGYGEKFPDLNVFTTAALLLTRVVSRPTANRITFDLGTKAVASDPPLGQRVLLPEIPDAVQVLQNEEHLVIETEHAGNWQPGDHTLAIPRHICPCSALHQHATVISQGEIETTWQTTARDRQITV